nr:hypothetical protein [Plasmopara viticola lesion associated mononegaambi virus 3]
MDSISEVEGRYKGLFKQFAPSAVPTTNGVSELQKTVEHLDSLKECVREMRNSATTLYHTANESVQGMKTHCQILQTDKITEFFDLSSLHPTDPKRTIKSIASLVEYVGVAAIHFAEQTNILNDEISFIDGNWKYLDRYVDAYNDLEKSAHTVSDLNDVSVDVPILTPPATPPAVGDKKSEKSQSGGRSKLSTSKSAQAKKR